MDFKAYKEYTKARIGLGHCGAAIPTKEWLNFLYHHASAKDAIYEEWNIEKSCEEIKSLGISAQILKSLAHDRSTYLRHPERGRALDNASKKSLPHTENEIVLVMSNGLSSAAVNNHGGPLLKSLIAKFSQENLAIACDKIFLIENARVAIIDDIGEVMKPKIGLILVGERPGLQSPDSLSAYLTYEPRLHRTDAERNCISNIRSPDGLAYETCALKIVSLIKRSMMLKISGVNLKDDALLME